MVSSSFGRSSWSKARDLSGRDRTILAGALLLLAPLRLLLRIAGYQRLARLLSFVRPLTTPPADPWPLIARTDVIVRAAAGRMPQGSSCLVRSLTLWLLLRTQGIETTVRLGVRRDGGRFDAHAWVELAGCPVNDTPDVGERYVTILGSPGR